LNGGIVHFIDKPYSTGGLNICSICLNLAVIENGDCLNINHDMIPTKAHRLRRMQRADNIKDVYLFGLQKII
jgi:hypothetical protein